MSQKNGRRRIAAERGIPVQVADILMEQLNVDESRLTLDALLVDDLMCDSLDLIELQLAFEEEIKGVSGLDDAVAERWATGTVKDLIADLRKAGATF